MALRRLAAAEKKLAPQEAPRDFFPAIASCQVHVREVIEDGPDARRRRGLDARAQAPSQPFWHRNDDGAVMKLIVYYVVFMILGDIGAYLIGLVIERAFGGQVSLIVFLAIYFLFLWVAWVLAVWLTEPKQGPHAASTPTSA
jgi:hypothetical protein